MRAINKTATSPKLAYILETLEVCVDRLREFEETYRGEPQGLYADAIIHLSHTVDELKKQLS